MGNLRLSSFLWFAPLAWLWFVLINNIRVEWTVNPQYNYGWAVPFLCVFLIGARMRQGDRGPETGVGEYPSAICRQPSGVLYLLFAVCALLYAPTRLIEEANPAWRLVSWALAIVTVGLTLLFVWLWFPTFQRRRLSAFAFPICYFLVAVPWPTIIEGPLVQGLTRLDTALTTELLGWLGFPAMPHGNVIEVATGVVGIDEACSGIRSFQATLMLSLFLGEFYRLQISRRAALCAAGFALSFLFNLARMSLLVWVAARKGVGAMAGWHDPAGTTILVACFFSLWAMGVWLKSGKPKTNDGRHTTEGAPRKAEGGNPSSGFHAPSPVLRRLATALGVWIVLTEFSVEAWYRWHEARVPAAAQWTITWPVGNPTFKEQSIPGVTRRILRYDEGRSAVWQETNLTWQAVFLSWKPGRTAVHLAQNHTPEVCLTAAGHTLNTLSPQEWFDVNGLRMPFQAYQVTDAREPLFVFYCLWDDRASAQGFDTMQLSYGNLFRPVLAGLRNPGQRSLEIAVSGLNSPDEAGAAVRAELEKLVLLRR